MSAAVQHYDGVTIPERKLRKVFAYYYEGDEGHERKVRIEFSNGDAEHYKGDEGHERKVRFEFSNGDVEHYEGDRGHERLVRFEFSDGRVKYYEGDKGHERVVRFEFSNGDVEHYEGDKGYQRVVEFVRSDGRLSEDDDDVVVQGERTLQQRNEEGFANAFLLSDSDELCTLVASDPQASNNEVNADDALRFPTENVLIREYQFDVTASRNKVKFLESLPRLHPLRLKMAKQESSRKEAILIRHVRTAMTISGKKRKRS